MPFFGYHASIYGPPLCFKSEDRPATPTCPLRADDLLYPLLAVREIAADEMALPLTELRAKYPLPPRG